MYPIIGSDGLIHHNFKSVFQGVGLLRNYEVHLHLTENPRPVACAPRYTPFHLLARVDKKIGAMLQDNIIAPHHGPAAWVSNVQVAPKSDGDIRVTIDMRNLNQCLIDSHIPIPTIDSIKAGLVGCRVFSKLDFKSSFHQLALAKSCQHLTVFRVNGALYPGPPTLCKKNR